MNPLIPLFVLFLFLLWLVYTHFLGAEYFPTSREKIKKALEMLKLSKKDIFYDLGSGFGSVIIHASRKCKKAIGIEADPLRFLISTARIKLLGIKNAKIIFGNIFRQNFSDATCIFLFLFPKTNQKLKNKLTKLKSARIVSHIHVFEGWKPVKTDKKMRLYLYVIGKSGGFKNRKNMNIYGKSQ